jgi:hypothetical protein
MKFKTKPYTQNEHWNKKPKAKPKTLTNTLNF